MTVSDQLQREQALDISSSFIVQAPAGSGKTGVLTLRILRLLTTVATPEEILAITFTKKAAAEMRVRVMEALELASHGAPPDNTYDQQFYDLGCQVLQRDSEKNWGLKQNQSRLRLLTIDSFCSGIVKNRPLGSGLGVQFGIAEDATELYKEASRGLLGSLDQNDDLGDALRRVLGQLDNQFSKLSSLVCQMLAQRDHWLGDVTQVHGDMNRFRSLLEHSLSNLNADALKSVRERFNPDFFPELDSLAIYAENQLHGQKINHPILSVQSESFHHQKEKLKLLLTKDLNPRSRLDKNGGFPAGENAAEKREAKAFKDRAKALIEQIERSGAPGLACLQDFISLPNESLTEPQWLLLEDLVLIMRFAAAHLKLVFQTQHSVDFSEVALAALATLGTADDPSDLTLLLDNRLSHILVDEFQDTSFIQVELLDKLTAGWEQGDGRTLFLVGDPMQSIYAFRKADVGLFIRLWHQRQLGHVALTPLMLATNFRSSETVIDWVNKTFSRVFPERADIRKGAVTYAPSTANRAAKNSDTVELVLFGYQEKRRDSADQAEAEWIADIIHQTPTEESIAVLVKGKAHVADIVTVLKAQGIPYQAVDIESLAQSQVITDLMSVANTYLSPGDKTAWFALLRGPWCGLTLAELHAINEVSPEPWTALQRIAQMGVDAHQLVEGLSAVALDKLKYLQSIFSDAYNARHRQSWQQALRHLVLALGVPATATSIAELEAIDLFFQLLDGIQTIADVPDFQLLMRKLEDLYVPPEVYPAEQRVVQIMTMHKSKGLEFDVVILPQLQRRPRGDDKPLILLDKQTAIASDDQELFLAPLDSSSSDNATSVYGFLWKLRQQRTLNESARLLYVACTRAKRKLFLSGCIEQKDNDYKAPDARSLLAPIYPLRDQMKTQITDISAQEFTESEPVFRRASQHFFQQVQPPESNCAPPPSEQLLWENDNEEEHKRQYRRHAGTLTHRLLEQLSHNPSLYKRINTDILKPQWRQELSRMGVSSDHLESALSIVVRAIESIQKSDTGRWLFGSGHAENHAEMSLLWCENEATVKNLIVDRVLIEDGCRYIIDYKLSEPEADKDDFIQREIHQYRPQLIGYGDALDAYMPMPTKMFLYFPLIDHLQEVSR